MTASLLATLTHPSTLRLHMGELTGEEVGLAQATLKTALELLPQLGCAVVPREPDPALLMSVALRWDHAIGLDGFYDGAEGPGAHEARKAALLERASVLYRALVAPVTALQAESLHPQIYADLASDIHDEDQHLVIKATVTYLLSQLRYQGFTWIPVKLTEEKQAIGLEVLAKAVETDGLQSVALDISRFYEEVAGEGFYRPAQAPHRQPI